MGTNYEKGFFKDYEQLFQQNEKMAGELRTLQYNYNLISSKYMTVEKKKQELAEQNAAKDVLITDLAKLDFKNEYLSWVVNFDIPFTNNLSERSLRGTKSKMKISEQFQNVKTASFYANIKSYLETCYRNGINEFYALLRLCRGDPFNLEEVFIASE